jgi:hypothetical protein
VGTVGPEDSEKVTLKRTVLRMTSEESEILERAFFVYAWLE